MLTSYLHNDEYDIKNSFVIGDRITDVQLAKNLGCKAFWLNNDPDLGGGEIKDSRDALQIYHCFGNAALARHLSIFKK